MTRDKWANELLEYIKLRWHDRSYDDVIDAIDTLYSMFTTHQEKDILQAGEKAVEDVKHTPIEKVRWIYED